MYIYALIDPRDDGVFYIGKSKNPFRRVNAHRNGGRHRPHLNPAKSAMCREIEIAAGMLCFPRVLLRCADESASRWERDILTAHHRLGFRLTNTAPRPAAACSARAIEIARQSKAAMTRKVVRALAC